MSEANAGTKPCPLCGETIRAEAVKCRFCGEMLDGARTDQRRQRPKQPKSDIDSKLYFQGAPSLLALLGTIITNAVILAIFGFLAFFPMEWLGKLATQPMGQMIAKYRPLVFIAVLVVIGISVIWEILKLKAISYTITNDRIEFERGVFSRKTDNLDLFRIRDLALNRSLTDRLLGIGTVKMLTSDQTHPVIEMTKIKNARNIYDTLKKIQLEADSRRRVIHYE